MKRSLPIAMKVKAKKRLLKAEDELGRRPGSPGGPTAARGVSSGSGYFGDVEPTDGPWRAAA